MASTLLQVVFAANMANNETGYERNMSFTTNLNLQTRNERTAIFYDADRVLYL